MSTNVGVGFLKREEIEAAALSLLAAYVQQFGTMAVLPPVPMEEIVECHLELDFGFDNLCRSLGMTEVLGATWINRRRVRIDESLDPTIFPKREGQYRFTVGHETGHWELHHHLFLTNANQASLFDALPKPSIVCRAQTKKDPMEWQADAFSSYLLMPTEMVFNAWKEMRGSLKPYVATEEIADLSARHSPAEDFIPTIEAAYEMAKIFKVSGQAMQIRLMGLGLIRAQDKQLGLFRTRN